MLLALTLIMFLGVLLLLNYYYVHDILYPPILQIFVWLLTLSIYLVQTNRFLPLSTDVVLIIIIGTLSFSIGSLWIYVFGLRNYNDKSLDKPFVRFELYRLLDKHWLYLCIVATVSILLALIFIKSSVDFARTGPTDDLALNLRYLVSNGTPVPTILKISGYGLPLLNALLGFTLIYYRLTYDKRVLGFIIFFFILAIAMAVFSTGRGIVLFSLIEVGIILLITSKKVKISYILWGVFIFIGVFYAGGAILGKGIDSSDTSVSIVSSLFDSISSYFVSGIIALSVRLPDLTLYEGGMNTMRSIFLIGRALGYDLPDIDIVQEYTNIPQSTNVYTMYLPYLKDYGIYGVAIFQMFFGFVHTYFYTLYKKTKNATYVFWISILSFAIFTQAFTDSYLSLLSTWLQYAFYTFMLSKFIFLSRTRYLVDEKSISGHKEYVE